MSDTAPRNLTELARRTGVEEYRLAMFGALVSLPDSSHAYVVPPFCTRRFPAP